MLYGVYIEEELGIEAGRPSLSNWDHCSNLLSGLPAHVQR